MTEYNAQTMRSLAARVAATSAVLQSFGVERVATAIAEATALLLDDRTDPGRALRDELEVGTGLSGRMIEWGLSSTLGSADYAALLRAAAPIKERDRQIPAPARLAVVILAGNVFAAALRAVVFPLLAGIPVVAKASEDDDALARYLKQALDRTDPLVGACYEVVTFGGSRAELLDALFEEAEVVELYGSDQTVAAVRGRLPPQVRLVEHGHGLGALYLPAEAVSSQARALEVIGRAALDVAAYDQRGCLSPHIILLQKGGAPDGSSFARMLAEQGLAPLQKTLARGHLPIEAAAAQLQWRGVAAARGRLFEGDAFAVSYEAGAELRPSPGFRNVGVYDCEGLASLAERLQAFGAHLKALGVAGDLEERRVVARALRPPLAPRICAVGAMQTPALDALADGQDPFIGLVRWIEVD